MVQNFSFLWPAKSSGFLSRDNRLAVLMFLHQANLTKFSAEIN